MDTLSLINAIIDAAEALDRARAKELTDELIVRLRGSQTPVPLPKARGVVEALRQKRYLDLVQRLSDTLIQTGHDDPRIRRNYAQALIDEGSRTAAILVLDRLVEDTRGDPGEHAEARGLMGRAYKQLYVDAAKPALERNRRLLQKAVDAYYPLYLEDPQKHDWPGINAVACLKRAERDGVPIKGDVPAPEELATSILERIEGLDPPVPHWDVATALEACVALGRTDEAVRWAKKYVATGAEPFQLGSTLRQLTEVWQLETTDKNMGAAVLPILRNQLLEMHKGGFFELSVEEVRQPIGELEKVLGHDEFKTISWYTRGLTRARAVARIGRETSRGDGTGFLVRGRDFLPELGDELLMLTNAHVVSDRPEHNPAVPRPADAWVTFDALGTNGTRPEYRVREVLCSSGPGELDFALLRLEPAFTADAPVDPYPVASGLPANDGKQRLYIIGHPDGGTLSFSIHDNLLLDYDARRLHYRTPTTGGSSGSPVFNAYWDLVALHHAGYYSIPRLNNKGGTYAANEGISIFAIRDAVRAALGAAPAPAPGG